jgi:hypothetical protein
MAIFLHIGAPGVIAQLYLFSSDAECRASVECAIRHFLVSDLLNGTSGYNHGRQP